MSAQDAGAGGIRVAVADDSVLLREGLVRLFDDAGFSTVGSYGDGDSLLAALADTKPDVVVLDVRMPPGYRDEGVRTALQIRRSHPRVGVLLLSQYVEGAYADELLGAASGGVGYLLKDRVASLDELRDAITRIAAGGTVLDPQVVHQLLAQRRDPLASLTPREAEVLQLMAEGMTNQGIARKLVVGVGAVEKNVTAIFAKLGLEASASDHRRVLAVLRYLRS